MEYEGGQSSSSTANAAGDGDIEASSSADTSHSSIRESHPDAASSSSPNWHGEGIGGGEDDDRGPRSYNYELRHPEIISEQAQQPQQQVFGINFFRFEESSLVRDDAWSCIIVIITFWFFVSMTLILGVYGSESFSLGPYASMLIEPNPIFVQSVKVELSDDTSHQGLLLYGLSESPSLDYEKIWSLSYNASVSPGSDKEWVYYLNMGSQINITYNISTAADAAFLVIAEGDEEIAQWVEDPTYPNTTLSWNVIYGSGIIQQEIYQSSNYYIAVGNLNAENLEIRLDLSVKSFLYNTSEAYYKCSVGNGECGLNVQFPNGISAVLTSPGSDEKSFNDEWYVRVTYGPRWATYIVGIAGMTLLMFAAFDFLNKYRCYRDGDSMSQYGVGGFPERAPLLQPKDDDLLSCGSSYESFSSDEKDLEEFLAANSIEGKLPKDGENGNNTRRLCAICYDAPRDCFFLPCGHCVACFDCGTRISEAAGICPVCRRNMKKVRRIFTV